MAITNCISLHKQIHELTLKLLWLHTEPEYPATVPTIKQIYDFRCKKSEKNIEYRITNCKVMNFKTSQSEASLS